MGNVNLFDMDGKTYTHSKNLTVRVRPDVRMRLDLIASERHWTKSQMINRMILFYLDEYEKLPKAKQTKFDFAG